MEIFSIINPVMSEDAPTIPSSVRELIGLWPSRRALSGAIGVSESRVHKWAQAGTIPARYHKCLIDAARSLGFVEVTADLVVALHSAPAVTFSDVRERVA